ncbi:MAG: hypothetical protein JO313_11870 [Verrucomicrobia bacterium]|nr:hypothetical protein [Verrucomicrobiota bacterium]
MRVPVLTAVSPGEFRIGNDGRKERLVVGNGYAELRWQRSSSSGVTAVPDRKLQTNRV